MADGNFVSFEKRVKKLLSLHFGPEVSYKIWAAGQTIQDDCERAAYYAAVVRDVKAKMQGQKGDHVKNLGAYRWKPVGIQEFIESEYYLNKKEDVYPKLMEELIAVNSGQYVEAVCTGGIGCGKTTFALYTTAYQLYLLSCLRNPHATFGLDSSSEILFIFQSINAKLARGVDYTRFRAMIAGSKYFEEHFPFRKDLESELIFPNRIKVVPVSGQETAAIGQNVIGGVIDEMNYMSVVEKSTQSVDKGTFDQAIALYNSIARRRKSRFMAQGKMPGILCLVSSRRYPGQFTDQKEEEAKTDKTIYVYDYRVWEIKPPGSYSGVMFRVFCGDLTRKPRILADNETPDASELALVIEVPVEYKGEFEGDIINSLREIAGVSTLARHPYLVNVEAVAASFGRHKSIFSRDSVDFVTTELELLPKRFFKPELPRYAHVDLAVSGDSAGLAIGTVPGFMSMKKLGFSDSAIERMPGIYVDGVLEICPPKNGEILFWKIRKVLTDLRAMGLNIRWVSFDSYESKDSQQLLRQQGFSTGVLSMDTTPVPYDYLKSAIYTRRLRVPTHARCQKELISLEKDTKTGKIDHPPSGSKDCSDALAGLVFGLTTRREIWGLYQVPIVALPETLAKIQESAAPVQSIA